ncbi:FtsX-like permease family protein [Mariniluteicoccus flavus]
MWRLATSTVRANRVPFAGTFLMIALASALLSGVGVLMESGLRAGRAPGGFGPGAGDQLTTLAGSVAGVALGIVMIVLASTMALVVQQRRRGFALLRAIGATPGQLRLMLTQELVVVGCIAAPVGAVPGAFAAVAAQPLLVAAGVIPAGFAITASPWPILVAVAVVVPAALIAAVLGARRHLAIAPTDALRQAAIESPALSRGRIVGACVCAVAGLVSAFSPWVLPGALGGATAGASALLLITAAGLAGPLLVDRAFALAAHGSDRTRGGAGVQLALANTRGFSRRLTAVVVPLALVVTLGTVQNLVGATLGSAATAQLRTGFTPDLIVGDGTGVRPEDVARLRALPGVREVAPTSTIPAEVRSDHDEEDPLPGDLALEWEPVPVLAVPSDISPGLLDLGVTEGSLAELARPGTIAISRDARIEHTLALGSTVDVRAAGGTVTATVVAVYDRGLGFGAFAVGEGSAAALAPGGSAGTVLVDAEPGRAAEVEAGVRGLGLDLTDRDAHIAAAVRAEGQSQTVSLGVLLILLAFVAVGALNALAMTTLGRRDEFTLLRVIGTSRAQILRTGAVEAAIVAAAAIGLGVVTVLPAVAGVTLGFAQAVVPTLSWPLVAGLVVTAALAPVVGIPLVAAGMTRTSREGRRARTVASAV